MQLWLNRMLASFDEVIFKAQETEKFIIFGERNKEIFH